MFSKPEFSPITVTGLQCNESVKTASEEAESHHGNCPQDGNGQRFFTVDDPGGEECGPVYRSTRETMPQGMANN